LTLPTGWPGCLKKGGQSVGVQGQDTGTAGRVENAQVAVYLVYASEAGHALIDRELYVPQGWIDDPDRCWTAGIPERVGFATKPALATQMLARTLDAGVPGDSNPSGRAASPRVESLAAPPLPQFIELASARLGRRRRAAGGSRP
jgi:DDE superfamily endonuclease